MFSDLSLWLIFIQFVCGIVQIICCLSILKTLDYGNDLNNGSNRLNGGKEEHDPS